VNKDVIISVRGAQYGENHTVDTIELITQGKYFKKGDDYYITYRESEVTGMEGTTTTLKISDGVITLMRFGAVNSQFVFEQGKKHISYYDTLYGAFTIGVFANEVDIKINERGGEIKVDYHLEIDNNRHGENDFHMFIREVGSTDDKHNREFKKGN